MYSTPQRKIDAGLKRFKLIDGQGNGKNTACAMSLLGWLAGHKKWNDEPICAHSDIGSLVIAGNDYTDDLNFDNITGELTEASEKKAETRRAKLVELGYEGVLDTWWIPQEIIEWATDVNEDNDYKKAVKVLKRVIKWKKTRHRMKRVQKWEVEAPGSGIKCEGYDHKGFATLNGENVWVRVS